MKVVILGSGLLGVTTAYVLASRGHEVEVIDRRSESAAECSHANGAQLSYSHAEPWATPGVLPKLPKWLIDPASPLVVRHLDLRMIRWGLQFLRNCTTRRAAENCANILRLNLYTKEKMAEIRAKTNLAFDFMDTGILDIFSTPRELDAALAQSEFQAKFGCRQKPMTRAEVLAFEPSLNHTARTIAGGLHSPMDETGDAKAFTVNLAHYCATQLGVRFACNETVRTLEGSADTLTAVHTNQRRLTADAFVLALGAYTPLLTKQLGFDLPIYPMKGYSMTLPASEFGPKPGLSVTDGKHKVVYTHVGDKLRIAGTAEFAGYNDALNPGRTQGILKTSRELFPHIDWSQPIREWACLRPSTPDGPPILGATPLRNLHLNTGHGTLGWTQGAGSAYIVADLLEHKRPEIPLFGLTLENRMW